MADDRVRWERCAADGCIGIRMLESGKCLAHAGEPEVNTALKRLGEDGCLDMRGVLMTEELLRRVLAAAPRDERGRRVLAKAMFDRATFYGEAWFGKVIFRGGASFREAAFHGRADFRWAAFHGEADFFRAAFHGDAWFVETAFDNDAWFSGVTFRSDAIFTRAAFRGNGMTDFGGAAFHRRADFGRVAFHGKAAYFTDAVFRGLAAFSEIAFRGTAGFVRAAFHEELWFSGAAFYGHGTFEDAVFDGDAWFGGATFGGLASFHNATFRSDAIFIGVTFKGSATFARAGFEEARQIGPLLAYRGVDLDGARFAQPVRIEASATGLCCRRARFAGGVQFRLRWARMVLDDADLAGPSTVTGIPRLTDDKLAAREQQIARAWRRLLAGEVSERPRLLSLRRADVAGLRLSEVNLGECRFAGAHNLDKLRIEADVGLGIAPSIAGWERRQVIAEERTWRGQRSSRWTAPWWPSWAGEQPPVLEAGQITGLYRALRTGRESSGDEPGAADFYYGEMEMRRHARHTQTGGAMDGRADRGSRGRAERGILTVYWLVSGYGLRAWRAFAWLVVVIFGLAAAFHLAGFSRPPQPHSYWTSLLYAFRATVSLTDNEVTLTAWGKLVQALLRLTGPVLLGLALLAVRNRVKR